METTKTVKVGDEIFATKEGFGAIFQLREWATSHAVQVGLTDDEIAKMLLFAAGSVEGALNALAYAIGQMKKE